MAKTPAASARKKTPGRGSGGRGSHSKTPRSGGAKSPKCTASETLLHEDASHQFNSTVEFIPRRDKFMKSDPLSGPTFNQDANCNWTVTIGDLACIEAAADDGGAEHPNGACDVTAPFSVRWRPCQILSLFRERDKSTESKLSKKKHWGPLKAEVRWFYRRADLDDRNRRYESAKRGSGGEEVFESGHVSVVDASLLLGRLVLKRSPGEEGSDDFLQYPVPTVEKHCHRYYFRKDQDVFETFDGENMVRRGVECSDLLKNEKVAAAVYRYLGLSPPKGNVEGDGRIALPPPSKSVKLHGEVAAYYSSCTLEHSWSQLKHGSFICPSDKRGAFPKWQLCVGDMVAVHMGDSTPASGADAIAGRDKWYPYRVKWSHGQVTAIFRSFDKMSDVPKEESTVDPSELICEIRWFPRPSEALAEGIRLLGKQLKQPVRDRLKQVAGDSERTCDVIIEGKQATTVVANCLLGPVLVEDKPGSNEELGISIFLPHNRRVVSDQVRCNAKGVPHEAKRMESVDFDPSLRVQRGISASKRFTGDAQRASVLKAALHCRRERAERLQHPEDAAGGSNDGDAAAESLSAESPQKKRQLFADYYEEEIAESKKRRLSEGTQRNDAVPATKNQVDPLPTSPAKKKGKQQPTATCRSAPFHVDVSALKSFYEEVEIAPQTESYDDRFAAGAGAKPWKVKLGDTVTVEVEPANAKESSVKFPFVVPWGPVEVVSIYRVHRTKESCARLREQLSRKGDEGNKFSPDDNSGEIMIEVRWFYRPWEIPGASKKKSEPMDDGELEEVFETDKIDNCSADSILSPVCLHDEKRSLDAPNAVMGMPCIHYHCGRLWSIHRRSFIPSGSLVNRISRGRMYSEYKSVLDMRQSALSIGDAATSNQKGDQTWKDAFQTAIQQLSLAAAAEDAQEKGMVLACRKKERDQIKSFLTKAITGLVQTSHSQGHDEDETSKNLKSSMFIAGPPGTGKTASVRSVVAELQKEQHGGKLPEFKFIALNGMELRHPFDAYIKFWEALSGTRKESLKAGDAAYELEHYFCGDQMEESEDESSEDESSEDSSEEEEEDDSGNVTEDDGEEMERTEVVSERPVTVLMLDEIDKLVTKKETLIYNLFDWPLRATTARLVVIGIANTINLPEKMSTRVQSRIGGNRCYFKSYDVTDTMTILKSRLGMLDGTHSYSVFEEDAIKFASRKAANLSGDIRKAFRMCKVAAEMVYEDLISGKRPMPRGNRPIVKISDVQKGSRDVFTSIVIKAVSHSTSYEALFMISLGALKRTREDGSFTIKEILTKIESIANASGEPRYMNARLSFADVLGLASRLGAAGIIQVTTHDSSPFPWISTHLETYEINGAFRDTKHSKLSEKHLANQRLF